MKKFLFLLMLGGALLSFNSCGTNYDALASGIHFDTMNSDTNFENFRHASDETQVSVLRDLCDAADRYFDREVNTVNDLREFEKRIDLLEQYYDEAGKKSANISRCSRHNRCRRAPLRSRSRRNPNCISARSAAIRPPAIRMPARIAAPC